MVKFDSSCFLIAVWCQIFIKYSIYKIPQSRYSGRSVGRLPGEATLSAQLSFPPKWAFYVKRKSLSWIENILVERTISFSAQTSFLSNKDLLFFFLFMIKTEAIQDSGRDLSQSYHSNDGPSHINHFISLMAYSNPSISFVVINIHPLCLALIN